MISDEHNSIFIHIPKCAGTSIENILFPTSNTRKWVGYDKRIDGFLQHLTGVEILDFNFLDRQTFDSMFKFAFVRNPWDRCVSEYVWRIKRSGNFVNGPANVRHGIVHPDDTKGGVKNTTFLEFLLRDFPWRELSLDQHMKLQTSFTHDLSGNQLVDFIGRFENLQEDFNVVCDKIGIPHQQLPHKNKSNNKHYTEYYDDETRQIVAEKYAKDIEYFGYEFGE